MSFMRSEMIKKMLICFFVLGLSSSVFAAQTTLTDMPSLKVGNAINVIGTNVQGNTTKQNAMNTELYAHIAAGNPWVAQETAPADTTKLWFDTDDQPGYVVLKIYTGGVWVAHRIGNDYTLPTAAADTLGGVKVGTRLSITDGVLSADVQTTDISGKQDTLVSGTNIKTINSTSLLGSGNITVSGTLAAGTVAGQVPVWSGSAWINSLLGAGYVSVTDSGNYWTATTVEGIFAEIGALPGLAFDDNDFIETTASGTTTVSQTVASGTVTIPATAVPANDCTLISVTATGATTSHWPEVKLPARLSTVNGYGVSSAGSLRVDWYLTAGNINFDVCNPTDTAITPAAQTWPWRVKK